jgi:exodeoxyribonuclease V alpha subunit
VPLRASTIHQLLEIGRSGHDGGGWGFQRNRDNPLSQRFVVLDEQSMTDTGLMADLLDACGDGTQVLLIGDPFQLPPVGHGAPLRDLLAAGLPQGNLTEVRRNAGMIVRGCEAIKAGERPEFAARLDLDADDPANLRFIECRPAETLGLIEDVLRSMSRFDPLWECQVLTATNDKSEVSRRAVNERLAKILNPDGARVSPIPFAVGDKVICLKNSKLRPAVPTGKLAEPWMREQAGYWDVSKDGETFVANGEVGRVDALGTGGMIVSIGRKSVWVAKSKPRSDDAEDEGSAGGAMGDWDLAYGITTHKSQGGEWPVVIVIADKSGGAVADRNWWYTAISRASKACLIVGDRSAFDTQCRRQSITQRKTFLTELLTE